MRIVILSHENSPELMESGNYMRIFAEIWTKQGHEVLCINGPDESIMGDIVVVHVDLTEVPARYLDYANGFPAGVNRETVTISKEVFSSHLLNVNSEYQGKVIVKTRANFGGVRELQREGSPQPDLANQSVGERPWRKIERLDARNYPIFDSVSQVPLGVWKNPRLIVQKFLPECDADGKYYTRIWYFMGKKDLKYLIRSNKPIVKYNETPGDDEFSENSVDDPDFQARDVPAELSQVRESLKIDYGNMDWGIHQGEVVVYDANKTPTLDWRLLANREYLDWEEKHARAMAGELIQYLN